MKRREFITLLGGAAAWPVAASAQQATMPVVGLLLAGLPEKTTHILETIRLGLGEANFFEGQNLAIEYRFANARLEQLPGLANDLVRRRVSLILAGPRTEMAAKAATSSIPIVFMSGVDPVRIGLVPSINRPGGNITGVTLMSNDLEAKRIGLLHELLPQAKSMAYLNETNHPEATFRAQQVQLAGRNLSIPIRVASVANESEFEDIFAAFSRDRIDALIVGASIYLVNMRDQLVKLAAQYKIPTIYEIRDFAEIGGLMSYAASVTDAWRQAAVYAGRVLKGAKPAELPVEQPTKFELVINLKTARTLGLEVPPMLLARADEVIE